MGLSNVYGMPGRVGGAGSQPATIIDGRAISAALREELANRIATRPVGQRRPGLATILVGADPASEVYVASKHRACAEVGIESIDERLPADCSATDLAATIERYNADDAVDGILLQLPLPDGLEAARFIELIDPTKDVDGLTAANVGRLWQGRPGLAPCTPQGVVELLDRAGVEIEGREAVIVGRSALVGKPLAAMLLARSATVTVCHSRTSDPAARCRDADILIAAVGVPEMLGAEHVKPGATVIDVGINRRADGLVGDVDFAALSSVAGAITPVPGGVGPMTIACLLGNTVMAAQSRGLLSERPL